MLPTHTPSAARRRSALLQSVSLGALVVAGAASPRVAAAATPFRSLNQALALAGHAAQAATAPSNAVTASAHAALGAQNLTRAAVQFRSLADALTAASGSAASNPIVIDGVGAGTGLQVAPKAGTAGGPLWQGAALPTSNTNGAGITVTVKQSQPLANLTWQTFNVGRKTTLNFDQSAGGALASSWVVINKVLDPSVSGSQILGAINAQGKVYVLNRNGIAFAKGSTVNVGSLIAATSDIAASQFSTTVSGQTSFNLYGASVASSNAATNIDPITRLPIYYQPTFVNGTNASITVAPGAVIQTALPAGSNGGGYVMLLGGNVTNAGIISTPLGQTVLAAGTAFTLRQGSSGASGTTNVLSTTLGSEVAATNYGTSSLTGSPTVNPAYAVYNTGSVLNAGIVVADQGDISLVGHALTQSGVLLSTTTVNQRGTIHFLTPNDGSDPLSRVTLSPTSVTEILPEDNGETALDAQRSSEVATSALLNATRAALGTPDALLSQSSPVLNTTNYLPDQVAESRVEISTGGSVEAQPGALVVVQGGQIEVGAGSRLLLESGSTLDVSGTTNAVLAGNINALDLGSTANTSTALSDSVRALLVNVQPFQLRDSAANRNGGLKGTNVYVDAATLVEIASGAYAGNIYTPGGLLEVSGYLGLVPHTIGEFTSIGGQVTLQAQQRVIVPGAAGASGAIQAIQPGSIVTQAGSAINLQGGTVSYQAASLPQTYVQATNGTIYDINNAPSNLVYTGLYTGELFAHPRWKVTFDYVNPLLTPPVIEQPSYTVGRDAGSIVINAATSAINGAVYAGVTLGQYQSTPRPAGVTDPFLLAQTVVPQSGTLAFGEFPLIANQTLTTASNVVFQATPGSPIAPAANPLNPGTSTFDAPQLDADGLGSIVVTTNGSISVLSPLAVADGGTVSLTGSTILVDAGITARSGAITLTDQLASQTTPVGKPGGITLAEGAVLDARGVWTNEHLDPVHQTGAGYANGGNVTIAGSSGVTLAAGSKIDVSSGGGVLRLGQAFTGRGGSVSVIADIPLVGGGSSGGSSAQATAPVVFDSTFVGYASGGGGTLSLAAPLIELGTGPTPASLALPANLTGPALATGSATLSALRIDNALFSTGFAKYVVNGTAGLAVLPGAQITASQPIYTIDLGLGVPSGSDPSAAYKVVLPVLFTPTPGAETLTQRAAASLSLYSATGGAGGLFPNAGGARFGGGAVSIGTGASVSVDPGASIAVAGYGQVSVLGTLTAHSGNVTVANTLGVADTAVSDPPSYTVSGYVPGVSVWIGAASRIDVSGLSVVRTDALGRTFGLAGAGGSITLGSLPGGGVPTFAQVIVRPGAVLDADGAATPVQVVQGADPVSVTPVSNPVTLAGAGGSIAADSLLGVALDGTATARAGAADAAGGTLSLTLDASNLTQYSDIPTYAFEAPRLIVTQSFAATQPATGLAPGDISPANTFSQVHASQQQIDEGGFGSVVLAAPSAAIAFASGVELHAARSIVLNSPVVGGISPNGSISVAAPYVALLGATAEELAIKGVQPGPQLGFSTLTVLADLIDQSGSSFFGGREQAVPLPASAAGGPMPGFGPPAFNTNPNVLGFGQLNLESTGDIRFLGTDRSTGGGATGVVNSVGNILLRAAQISPGSLQRSVISAGITSSFPGGTAVSGGTITVEGNGNATALPYSVGGQLAFIADTIVQGGVIRAPEGIISFSDGFIENNPVTPSRIAFTPGSVTSVSLAGQTIPYGGTVDGVTYIAPGGGAATLFNPQISVQAQSIDVQNGASIDLRGGGTLSGAGFVFGRGGTADVLTTPLLDIQGGAAVANAQAQVAGIQPVRTGDPVYAILPGYASAYAPTTVPGDTAYTATNIGEQISVGTTVPGLAAGTYTLLPAYYALLPGAYRVELTSGVLPPQTSLTQGNFTASAPVTIGVANTAISAPVAVSALFTSGTNVRLLSQYDEESYNTFEATTATQFGAPRPFLPQDAKTLSLLYPSAIGTGPALSFAPGALLEAPAPGGYGATLQINFAGGSGSTIVVAGNTPPLATSNTELVLSAPTLDALDVPRLVLGGTLAQSLFATDTVDIASNTAGVVIQPNARLTAGDILLTTTVSGQIIVAPGGTLSTIGAGAAAYDNNNGFFFDNQITTGTAIPVLDVSNGRVVFVPNTDAAAGASISVGAGSGLLASGSLNIVAPGNTQVTIGAANLGAQYASIAVAAINIGSTASLARFAGQLPSGFSVTPQALSTLLNGSPTLRTPAATQLTLSAAQEVNFLGSVALDSGTTDLVLNTPAIYGVGAGTDTVSIAAPSFTWSGVATQQFTALNSLTGVTTTALPGGQIAGGLLPANGIGHLDINAGTIVLGYGPQAQPNDQVLLQRFVAGFGNVALNATRQITANNQSGLTVFQNGLALSQTASGLGATGALGNLTLNAPLITTQSAAVLDLTAGGTLKLVSPGPVASTSVVSLGGQIDAIAGTVDIGTAIALRAGQFNVTAQNGIDVAGTAAIDLSGRPVTFSDQTRFAPAGTLAFESTAGSITLETGSRIDVSATGASAGSVAFSALAGGVALDGTLVGAANPGQTGGSFTVIAGTLATTTQAANVAVGGSAFDNINAGLNAGGFTGARSFELGTDAGPPGGTPTANLVIGNDTAGAPLVVAQTVRVTADRGAIDVTGTIDASGTGPGAISLQAQTDLTLAATAVLDAHATQTAVNSYGSPIDAANRAHVTLAATTGTLTLAGGAIDVSYAGDATIGTPQGQVVLDAPRLGGATGGDIAIQAAAPIAITGAQSVALYGWTTYTSTDPNGRIVQTLGGTPAPGTTVIGLAQIDQDNTAFITAADGNAGLAGRLAGLTTYDARFHLRPGVQIDSAAVTRPGTGNLTIAGDLDFSGFRYSDAAGYGLQATGALGSGEPGAIVFRAAADLVVNGSVTDGFAAPPDKTAANHLKADNSWVFLSPNVLNGNLGAVEPLSADVVLPASISVTQTVGGVTTVTHQIELGAGTTIDESRPVSLNYAITINSAAIGPNVVVPFTAVLDPANPDIVIPNGGFITTAAITPPTGPVIPAGTFLPGGSVIPAGSTLGKGTVLPVTFAVATGTVVPAGTLLSIFDDTAGILNTFGAGTSALTLSANTAPLPVNAFLPSNTAPQFIATDGQFVGRLDLRPVGTDPAGQPVQGYVYALSKLLPPGALSWNLDLVAGANQASANPNAVLPRSVLAGGALAKPVNTIDQAAGSLILSDTHYLANSLNVGAVNPAFSVLRTGTGDLSLIAGGNFDQSSFYGIYTAGTQSDGVGAGTPYDLARQSFQANPGTPGRQGIAPGGPQTTVNTIVRETYQANYPTHGGDVLLSAQGNAVGDLNGGALSTTALVTSDAVGNWLWRQGSTQLGQSTAWWINYGTFAVPYGPGDSGLLPNSNGNFPAQLVGFQGIGTLGGGNLTVNVGQNAGQQTDRTGNTGPYNLNQPLRGEGLVLAVASTGREVTNGGTATLVETGGGNLTLHVGGTINPINSQALVNAGIPSNPESGVNGTLIDLRGAINVTAGAVGRLDESYVTGFTANELDPRPISPFAPILTANGGITLLPGDSAVSIVTQRDVVLDGVGDAGRVTEQNLTQISQSQIGTLSTSGGATGFTLWTNATSVALFTSGGNAAPITIGATTPLAGVTSNDSPTDTNFIYPSQLYVTSASGEIAYGSTSFPIGGISANVFSIEVAPSANEQVAFLAGTTIQANGLAVDLSGADPAALSTPLDPAFASFAGTPSQGVTNIRPNLGTTQSPLALFAKEADTPSVPYLGTKSLATPALFYAETGDILDLITGETVSFTSAANEILPQWYLAAKPVRIVAAQDIISSGTAPAANAGTLQQNQRPSLNGALSTASGNLFLNNSALSISTVFAGRDILGSYFYVGGPGLLAVEAGRNIQQIGYAAPGAPELLNYGSIKSLGSLLTGAPVSLTGGASIELGAGLGAGLTYTDFANLYFNPANQANLALLITDPANKNKVQQVYATQLVTFLQQNYGYTGTAEAALAFFLDPAHVPVVSQSAFVRDVFFAELLASGLQYNDPNSRFFHSYSRGQQAIGALFTTDPKVPGVPAGYTGAITMASGSLNPAGTPALFDAGVATEHGGTIQVLDPGGQVVLGTTGAAFPGGGTGLVTNGNGDIDVFSNGSFLLGKSRAFTNAGGNIQVWSATGDINAGIGARTTVVFNPPVISYDNTGGLVNSPAVPTSGSGIATNQPLPSVPLGNIDLTAPVGTIDAGEAGVRSSGNLNLAAARLANSSGFSSGGKTSGNSAPASVNLGAVEAAGAAAGAGQQAAQNLNNTHTAAQLPSLIEVEVLSISGESEEERRKKRKM